MLLSDSRNISGVVEVLRYESRAFARLQRVPSFKFPAYTISLFAQPRNSNTCWTVGS